MHKLLNAVYDLHAAAYMFSRILLKIKFIFNIDFFYLYGVPLKGVFTKTRQIKIKFMLDRNYA